MSQGSVILIGREPSKFDDAAERLLGGVIVALQEFDTETLEGIAALCDEMYADGWMQKMIREYVEVWR